jgi:ArsR family transcriptional regulator
LASNTLLNPEFWDARTRINSCGGCAIGTDPRSRLRPANLREVGSPEVQRELQNVIESGLTVGRDAAVVALGALAQEIRLEMVSLLAAHGPEGLPAGAIAAQLGVAPASLSFHFQQLVRADLLTQRRRSRNVMYAANFRTMGALLAYLGRRWRCNPASATALGSRLSPTQEDAATD